jgi:hypothetical protein
MKYLFIFLALCLFACKERQKAAPVVQPSINFDWLNGHWQRSNDEAGQVTYEHWSKSNDSLYLGVGFTMKGSDTIWQENVKLFKSDTAWIFSAISNGETATTDFVLTSKSPQSFACENAANEFPKKIEYKLKGPDILFSFGKKK